MPVTPLAVHEQSTSIRQKTLSIPNLLLLLQAQPYLHCILRDKGRPGIRRERCGQ